MRHIKVKGVKYKEDTGATVLMGWSSSFLLDNRDDERWAVAQVARLRPMGVAFETWDGTGTDKESKEMLRLRKTDPEPLDVGTVMNGKCPRCQGCIRVEQLPEFVCGNPLWRQVPICINCGWRNYAW